MISCIARTSLSASLHWEIDWLNAGNSYGTYATKNLIPRLAKLVGIVQQRVAQLEDEIDLNFAILMTITSMMGVVLIMTLHACYISCKQRMDTALPTPRVPSDLFMNTTTRDLSSNKYSLEVFAHSFCPSYPDMKSLIKVLYDGFSQTDVRQKLFLC